MKIAHYYRKTEPPHSLLPSIHEELTALGLVDDSKSIAAVETESCFNVRLNHHHHSQQQDDELTEDQASKLNWLLAETFDKEGLQKEASWLTTDPASPSSSSSWTVEFGPRMTFTSAFSSNAVSICQACNLPIERLELSRRYRFLLQKPLSETALAAVKAMLHDRMTEQEYTTPITSFDSGATAQPVRTIPIMEEGRPALERINQEMGLGFDDHDLDYYTELFRVSACVRAWLRRKKSKKKKKKHVHSHSLHSFIHTCIHHTTHIIFTHSLTSPSLPPPLPLYRKNSVAIPPM
jgi:phosphoribosylformylglycinamidine synthase